MESAAKNMLLESFTAASCTNRAKPFIFFVFSFLFLFSVFAFFLFFFFVIESTTKNMLSESLTVGVGVFTTRTRAKQLIKVLRRGVFPVFVTIFRRCFCDRQCREEYAVGVVDRERGVLLAGV